MSQSFTKKAMLNVRWVMLYKAVTAAIDPVPELSSGK